MNRDTFGDAHDQGYLGVDGFDNGGFGGYGWYKYDADINVGWCLDVTDRRVYGNTVDQFAGFWARCRQPRWYRRPSWRWRGMRRARR